MSGSEYRAFVCSSYRAFCSLIVLSCVHLIVLSCVHLRLCFRVFILSAFVCSSYRAFVIKRILFPIDLQKMDQKFRTGLQGHTSVSLKERLPKNSSRRIHPCASGYSSVARPSKTSHHRLQQAYRRDDARLVRRITVLIDLLVHHVPVAMVGERWGLSPACLYAWQKAFLLHGLDSLVYRHSGGRPFSQRRSPPEVDPASEATLGRAY